MTLEATLTLAHLVSGPVDALIELGVPVAIFLALFWWSSRKERRKKG